MDELSMKQVCNYVYAVITDGMTAAQIAEFDVSIAPPESKDEMLARQNAIAMQSLGAMGMVGPMPPQDGKR